MKNKINKINKIVKELKPYLKFNNDLDKILIIDKLKLDIELLIAESINETLKELKNGKHN